MLNGDIAQIILSIAIIVTAAVLVPVAKSKLADDSLAFVEKWIRYAVAAYEQIFNGSGMGLTKKRAVVEFIGKKGIKLTADELDVLIEKAVYELKANN